MSDSFSGLVSPLAQFGLIYVSGTDTLTFLQGQTTIDVNQLATDKCLLGAFCNPKGRVVASFMATSWADGVMLVLPADNVSGTLAHLKKYAAFFKTQLVDASKRWHLLGTDSPVPTSEAISASPQWDDNRHITFLNPLADDYETALEACLANKQAVDEHQWMALDIQMGIAWIDQQAAGEHTPHHLNLQWNNGINFKKGCYTGQEVVSRMQFKAKLKSIAYALQCGQPMKPAQAIYNREGKAVGTVINAANEWALGVVHIKELPGGLFADAEAHLPVTPVSLPYQDAIQATLEKQASDN